MYIICVLKGRRSRVRILISRYPGLYRGIPGYFAVYHGISGYNSSLSHFHSPEALVVNNCYVVSRVTNTPGVGP